MNNKTYDTLKTIASILPLLATFILGLKDIWGIPYADQIAGTLGILATLILGILQAVSKEYFKDKIIIDDLDKGKGEE